MRATTLTVLALAAVARVAHADPVADWRVGATAAVRVATIHFSGTRGGVGRVVAKTRGSLDLTLSAADLGATFPIQLRLHGTSLGNGRIDFVVDETFTPRVDLGGHQTLSKIGGTIHMRALPLPGRLVQEVGNVRLTMDRPSELVARGTWGAATIAVARLEVHGGVAQPLLASFEGATICSAATASNHVFDVSLVGPATASGAFVELAAPPGASVHVPHGIVVPAGRQHAGVPVQIDARFTGTVRVTAAEGGITKSLDVVVRDCERP